MPRACHGPVTALSQGAAILAPAHPGPPPVKGPAMTDLPTRTQDAIAAVTKAAEQALAALRDAAGAALAGLTASSESSPPGETPDRGIEAPPSDTTR